MSYQLLISEKADRKFKKINRRNKKQMTIINKKIQQIITNPFHFKPLRGDMHGARRVHISKSFVLIYEIDRGNKIIKILDFNHHDTIYKK